MPGQHRFKLVAIEKPTSARDKYDSTTLEYADESYQRIRNALPHLTLSQRAKRLEELELMASESEQELLRAQERNSRFNKEIAIQVRLDSGMTPKQLARQLGIAASTIYRYEKGISTQMSTHKDTRSRVYFVWLAKQGYNPFDIEPR